MDFGDALLRFLFDRLYNKMGSLLDRAKNFSSTILSRLGITRPIPSVVRLTDEIWLFDNTAFRQGPGGAWHAEFVACYFQKHSSRNLAYFTSLVADAVDEHVDENNRGTVERRLEPFLDEVLPGRVLNLDFARSGEVVPLGPASSMGISSNTREVPAAASGGGVVRSDALLPQGFARRLSMYTHFADPDGLAIISDIDDTIKVSQVRDRRKLLYNTFVDSPAPVHGMSELYRAIASAVPTPAVWFYLSASPFGLYPVLRKFTAENFPAGQVILRDMSYFEIESFVASVTIGTQSYKEKRIAKIHSWLPERKFLLVGDSTQTDPEAYGASYRRFPGSIRRIWIRQVEGVDLDKERYLNSIERFEKAFKDVPRNVWRVFRDPWQLQKHIDEVLS